MRTLIFLLAVLAGTLAAEPVFILELGMKGILEPGACSPELEIIRGSWKKAGKNTKLTIRGDAFPQWRKYSFSFVPKKKGFVELTLKSSSALAVAFDDLSMTGSTLLNGGFEDLRSDKKTPSGWGVSYETMTNMFPLSGSFCISVAGKQYAVQSFHVNAGEEIKLEFHVRSAINDKKQMENQK